MNTQDGGGPAFPVLFNDGGRLLRSECGGMTLRDYFAAKAPLHDLKFESVEAASGFCGLPMPKNEEELVVVAMSCAAKASYIYADAMLKARKQ